MSDNGRSVGVRLTLAVTLVIHRWPGFRQGALRRGVQMSNRFARLGLAVFLFTIICALLPAPSQARVEFGDGVDRTSSAQAGWCSTEPIENPHYSSGSNGVISKSWLTCSGGDARVTIETTITRGTAPIGPNPVVLQRTQTKTFSNGVRTRVWFPSGDYNGASCTNGRYYRTFVTYSASGGTISEHKSSNQIQINNCP